MGLSTISGKCQAGYYCAEGAAVPHPDDGVTGGLCPAGTYCPAGSHRPTSCPPGTFSNIHGQVALSSCHTCPSGFYCKDAGLTTPNGQCPAGYYCDSRTGPVKDFHLYPCPQGFYCPLGTSWGKQNSCPVGTYGPWQGLKGITECQLCPAGKYCAGAGLSTPTGDCDEGYWCKEGASVKNPTDGMLGLLCPPGHYCLTGTLRPAPCPPGTWSKEGNKNLVGCQTCLGDHFCNSSSPLALTRSCNLRFQCTEDAILAYFTDGGPCYTGYFCSQEMKYSTSCPLGSYTPFKNSAECHICPSGQYCVPEQKPQLCPRGFYCPEGTGLNWQPCPAGTYGPVPGLGSLMECRVCDRGKFCLMANATDADCSPCPPGHYCNATGLTAPSGLCSKGFFCLGGAITPNSSIRDRRGGPCPTGHFCPRASVVPQVCLAGFYNPLPAQSSCKPCPQGFFCPENSSSFVANECPAGHYCPPATASASQFPCPRGTYNPQKGSDQVSDCIPCDPGMYCPVPGLAKPYGPCNAGFHCIKGASLPNPTDGVTGNLCPAGHTCPQGSPEPVPCPSGSFLPFPGASSMKDCQPCPAGWFCSQQGLSFPEAACEEGWFCPIASISGNNPGNLCPIGHYCPSGSPEPQLCPSGQYQDETGQSQCKMCPAGKFCPSKVQSSEPKDLLWPVDCPAHYYCPPSIQHPFSGCIVSERPKASSPEECQPRPAGQFCNSDINVQGPKMCPQGHFCPPGTQLPTQHPCPQGTFGPRTGASSELDCEPCPAGMYCSSEGLSHPSGFCYSGHYCTGGAVSPTPIKHKVEIPGYSGNDICPSGFFCPNGTGSPIPCPPGTYSSSPGLDTEEQCQPCPRGKYCSTAGLASPSQAPPCSPGYICLEGSISPSPSDGIQGYRCPHGFYCLPGASMELPCEPGTFSPMPGMSTCFPCPGGTFCQQAASVEPTICPKGYYCPAHSASALPCPEGTLNSLEGAISLNACQSCPMGRYCPREGSWQPGGLCSAGYYCEGGAIWPIPKRTAAFPLNGPCPKGHYCPEGTLTPLPCPKGTLRNTTGGSSEGSCLPCPAGFFCSAPGLSSPTGSCTTGFYCPSDLKSSNSTNFLCPQVPPLTSGEEERRGEEKEKEEEKEEKKEE
ncbi:uncharacterized protein LOC141562243 [Sminthopsis crassicaudata]|uniref:uncharacterized protein LOC141562243 n=1 Tax=Sminthopsis crassicaudata TaxID=9301 RepID=UPI003D68D9D2